MHTTLSFVTILAGIAAATGTPISRRDQAGSFQITDFHDGGAPISIEATISFTVTDSSASTPLSGVTCSASQSVQPSVATAVFGTACAAGSDLVFGLQSAGDGYFLTLAHYYSGNETTDAGSIYLGHDVQTAKDPQGNPNGDYQYLNHPTTFSIGYNRV